MVNEREGVPGIGDTGTGVIKLFPLAEVVPGSNIVVARSADELAPFFQSPTGFSLHSSVGDLNVRFSGPNPAALLPPGASREILLRNRGYIETDYSLNYFLGAAITRRADSHSGQTAILDIGGGYESSCAIEIGSGEGILVTNVDVFLKNEVKAFGKASENVTPLLADARDLPLPDESQDVVYSSRLLQYFEEADFIAAMSEIVRVLKPEGDATLFDSPYEGRRKMALTKRLSWELGVHLLEWESNINGGKVITLFKPKKSIRPFPRKK